MTEQDQQDDRQGQRHFLRKKRQQGTQARTHEQSRRRAFLVGQKQEKRGQIEQRTDGVRAAHDPEYRIDMDGQHKKEKERRPGGQCPLQQTPRRQIDQNPAKTVNQYVDNVIWKRIVFIQQKGAVKRQGDNRTIVSAGPREPGPAGGKNRSYSLLAQTEVPPVVVQK